MNSRDIFKLLTLLFFAQSLSTYADIIATPKARAQGNDNNSGSLPRKGGVVSVPAATQPESVLDGETKLVLRAVAEKYKKFHNWEASFIEKKLSVALGKGSANEGKFVFSNPNRFVYQLQQPERSEFISNGKEAWFFTYPDGRDKAPLVRHFADLKNVELDRYLLVLRGVDLRNPKEEEKLTRDFRITGTSDTNKMQLELEPKKSSEIARVTLIFKTKDEILSEALLEDALGNKTTIILGTHRVLKSVPATTFEGKIPANAKIEKL